MTRIPTQKQWELVQHAGACYAAAYLLMTVAMDYVDSGDEAVKAAGFHRNDIKQESGRVQAQFDRFCKAFDKVLVRNDGEQEWWATLFSSYRDGDYWAIDGLRYSLCIPYEGNEHLAFTCDSPYGKKEETDDKQQKRNRMDTKKLQRLNDMEAEIRRLKTNIGWWEDMDSIKRLIFQNRNGEQVYVDCCDIDVQRLKAETLQSMRDKLDRLEKEFREA